ncbi:MAG: methyltransferase domain-containing protein [Armatimonadota bacterium]
MPTGTATACRRLHLGCGRNVLKGYVNLDVHAAPGVDVVADLNGCDRSPLPFEDDTFDEVLAEHLIEHIENVLPMMQELHRVCKPGAIAVFKTPYGASDDAFEDPTHVRQMFIGSWGFFSQPYYWRADYGYRGDWQPERIVLRVSAERHKGQTPHEIFHQVTHMRNIVAEMVAELRCVKPIREAKKDLQTAPKIEIDLVG